MKLSLFIILISLLFITINSNELLCVIQISRHGARTARTFTSKVLSDIFGNEMILTPNGFRQHMLLGQYIRNKYTIEAKFLKSTYSKDQFELYTTPLQRTINSALGFISGLYPNSVVKMEYEDNTTDIFTNDTIPIDMTNYKDQLNINEVPIKVISKKNDIFHRNDCKYKGEKLKNLIASEHKDIFDINHSNLTECAVELGKFMNVDPSHSDDIDNGVYLNKLEKYLQSFLYHYGKTLDDESFNKDFSQAIKMKLINQKYGFRLFDSKYMKMLTSEIFEMILGKFESSIRNPFERKLFVYLSHDSTLMNLLTNLFQTEELRHYTQLAVNNQTIYEMIFPPYASVIMFELYQSKQKHNNYYVNINLNGNSLNKGLKYISDYQISANGNIALDDFRFMINQLIEKDTKKLVCKGVPLSKFIDNNNNDSLNQAITNTNISKPKKNYTRHFLKQPVKINELFY